MNFLLSLLTVLHLVHFPQENAYVGTWEYYDIRSFKNKYEVTQKEFKSLQSQIVFKADMSFIKTTNGKITTGKYDFTENSFNFYEKNKDGEYHKSWTIRVPPNSPIDLNYPELFTVTNKKGKSMQVELDVYYKKQH